MRLDLTALIGPGDDVAGYDGLILPTPVVGELLHLPGTDVDKVDLSVPANPHRLALGQVRRAEVRPQLDHLQVRQRDECRPLDHGKRGWTWSRGWSQGIRRGTGSWHWLTRQRCQYKGDCQRTFNRGQPQPGDGRALGAQREKPQCRQWQQVDHDQPKQEVQ